MKKRFAFLASVCAVLAMTACSSTDESIDAVGGFGMTSLDAFIEERPDSRTVAEQNEDGSIQMLWRADDEIAVTDLTNTASFKLKSGAKSVHGVFSGSIMSRSKTMYAVYPASATEISAGEAKVTLPNIQTYSASADADTGARNIMVGVTSDAASFDFYTVAAIARFKIEVDADETVNSVTMRVEDGYLSGLGSVDLEGHSLGTLNKRNVTLNYTEPAKGVSSDGWVLIAPIDFTATSGNVYYDVTTSKGKYTFCRKPTKALRAGMVYNFPLSKSEFAQAASTDELSDGQYVFESNASTLTVNLVRATDTTISVGWSAHGFPTDYSVDTADLYELYLYDERNQLLVSWQPNDDLCVTGNALFPYTASNPTCPPRFVFTGLAPNTVYKVQVKNLTTAKKSAMLTVSTAPTDCGEIVSAARNEGETILFENFGKLVWNGDITTLAAGYVPVSYSSITDIVGQGTAWGDYTSASQTTYKYTKRDREQQLFITYKSIVNSCGLGDWAWWRNSADDATSSTSCAILARPGYLKLGVTAVRAGIVTPELSALLGKATVRVTFKACTYGTLSADDNTAIGVCAVDDCTVESNYKLSQYTEIDRKTLDLDKKLEWNTYSVELSGVTATSRIIIFSNAASVSSVNNRFHVDDIKVEFVKYDEATSTDIPVVKQVAASPYSATVEWSESDQASRKYTVAIYKNSACTDKYQEYTTTISSSKTYIEWPARFTFPYLEPQTTYYVTVTDLAGNVSKSVAVTTSALRTAGTKEVMYEGFDKLCWGGDYINMANSVTLSGVTVGTYAPDALTDALSKTVAASSPTTDGSRLTSYSAKINQLFGLEEWSSNAAHVRQGFVKLGTASEKGWITTPYLCNLSGNGAQINVSFKACPFVDGSTDQTSFIYVNLLNEDGTAKDSRTVTIGGSRNIPGWETFSVDFSSVNPTDRVQFMAGGDSQSRFCIDDILVTSSSAVSGPVACGFVTDSDGNPLSGVVVSDGFSAVQTNASGYYSLFPNSDAWYIFYSIPEDCKVGVNSYGQPCFYERYSSTRKRYDFTIEKLPNGAETDFNLFCFADPQCRPAHVSRFKTESIPDIKTHAATKTLPCYGVTLGDIVYSEGGTNTVSNMPTMRDAMAKDNMGMPVFQVMGNHDYTYFYSNKPLSADATSSTTDIKCQREFETVFGPINYSWNRGDVHIVCMRNIIFNSTTDASNYSLGFTDEQYQWLRQDLSFVPKTKMVILCVHIPIVNSKNQNVQNVLTLLKQFKEGHIMSGHTHYMRNEPTKSGMYEHVHAAVCGAWWYSNLNGDGCPNGYAVYTINGSTMTDWYYKGVNAGMNDRDYQIRLYRGDIKVGGKYEYLQYQHGSDVLLANVFNADSDWTVKVYENGVYTGNMTLIANKKYDNTTLPFSSTNSTNNPTLVPTDSSQDYWAIGYHIGVVGRGHVSGNRNSYMTNGFHIYKYTLKNAGASVMVVATDKFGNKYSETEITGDYDYTLAVKP